MGKGNGEWWGLGWVHSEDSRESLGMEGRPAHGGPDWQALGPDFISCLSKPLASATPAREPVPGLAPSWGKTTGQTCSFPCQQSLPRPELEEVA